MQFKLSAEHLATKSLPRNQNRSTCCLIKLPAHKVDCVQSKQTRLIGDALLLGI